MARQTKDVSIQVMGRDPLEEPAACRAVFAAVEEEAPQWMPARWDETEPIRRKWDGPDEPCASWDIMTRAAKGAAQLDLQRRRQAFHTHTNLDVRGAAAGLASDAVVRLFRRACSAMDADYGLLHLLHPPAWGETRPRYVVSFDGIPEVSIPPWVLQLYLPGIYWAAVLGPSYVELFGEELLAGAPCHLLEEYEPGRFYLQMTPDLYDCRDDYWAVVETAGAVMDHLGRDAFVDPARYQQPGRTPDFSYLRQADPPRPFVPLQP